MKSSIHISNDGNTIRLKGKAANDFFNSIEPKNSPPTIMKENAQEKATARFERIVTALDKLMRGTVAHESRNQTLQAIADIGALKNEHDALLAVAEAAKQFVYIGHALNNEDQELNQSLASLAAILKDSK